MMVNPRRVRLALVWSLVFGIFLIGQSYLNIVYAGAPAPHPVMGTPTPTITQQIVGPPLGVANPVQNITSTPVTLTSMQYSVETHLITNFSGNVSGLQVGPNQSNTNCGQGGSYVMGSMTTVGPTYSYSCLVALTSYDLVHNPRWTLEQASANAPYGWNTVTFNPGNSYATGTDNATFQYTNGVPYATIATDNCQLNMSNGSSQSQNWYYYDGTSLSINGVGSSFKTTSANPYPQQQCGYGFSQVRVQLIPGFSYAFSKSLQYFNGSYHTDTCSGTFTMPLSYTNQLTAARLWLTCVPANSNANSKTGNNTTTGACAYLSAAENPWATSSQCLPP